RVVGTQLPKGKAEIGKAESRNKKRRNEKRGPLGFCFLLSKFQLFPLEAAFLQPFQYAVRQGD
ncbi:MAG: hypothetical protein NT167_11650, partial [Verrucomicrobia bacterium]|nr:hypothetical protein [Verrucomicrobiota bacterium]